MTPEKIAHFQTKLLKTESCWLYTGYVDKNGNGFFAWIPYSLKPKGNKNRLAHHVAWMVFKGEIPEGKDIVHTCPNNHCCNPDHLIIGVRGTNPNRPHKNRVPIEERFWSFVEKKGDDECWGWTGSIGKDPKGNTWYGKIRNRSGSTVASRVSWEIHNGKIPDGLLVCHTCDNPICTNPKHLFLGTYKDNMQDALSKNRLVTRRGEKCNKAKLTVEQVIEIRSSYTGKRGDLLRLSKVYGIASMSVLRIVRMESWKHVP